MKKLLLFAVLFQIAVFCKAESAVTIKGKWDRQGNDVSLYYIVSGRIEMLSTYKLQQDRTFGFLFTPESTGYYVIGDNNPLSRTNKYVFFFKPGDKLYVEVNEDKYQLIGENTPENRALTDWYNSISDMENIGIYYYKGAFTYVDFFPLLEEFTSKQYVPQKTGNNYFDNSFADYRKYDLLNMAVSFLFTPRATHPQNEDFIDFYQNINIEKLTKDASLMEYPYGSKLLSNLFYIKARVLGNDKPYNFNEAFAMIKNDTLKGEYLLQQAEQLKTYTTYLEKIAPLEQYIITPDQKNRSTNIIAKLAKESSEQGQIAINFTHKDVNGKNVSLSDFKGKVVLVDVWATWCGPCIAQIPHLKNLEKQYEGKDIVFMGVSLDEKKDYEKWEEFIEKEELKGIQLFAGGFNSDIAKFYDIKGIPRFMLFDKKGNIVSKDAPRPASEELKALIEAELKK